MVREEAVEGLLLSQIVQSIIGLSNEFPMEVVDVPRGLARLTGGKHYLAMRTRMDADRDELSMLLNGRERLASRLQAALDSETSFISDTWHLIEESVERDDSQTSWEFLRRHVDSFGERYIFVGDREPPRMQAALIAPAELAGAHKPFNRQLKAWRLLCDHPQLLRALRYPEKVAHDKEYPLIEDDGFAELDPAKQDALRLLLSTRPLAVVQGPPGVGKSRLVAELAAQVLRTDATTRLLFSAQSHAAVNALMRGVQERGSALGDDLPLFVRCTMPNEKYRPGEFDVTRQVGRIVGKVAESEFVKGASESLRQQVFAYCERDSSVRSSLASPLTSRQFTQRALEALLLRSAQLVFGTTNSGALERMLEERVPFDWTVVEEAAKGTGNELLGPLLLGHRRIMIGDHRQLPPFNAEVLRELFSAPEKVQKLLKVAERIGSRSFRDARIRDVLRTLGRNSRDTPASELKRVCAAATRHLHLFERLITDALCSDEARPSDYACVLTHQHRMHPTLGNIVSHAFYNDELLSAETCKTHFATQPPPVGVERKSPLVDVPFNWIDMPWDQATIGQSGSERRPGPWNRREVAAVLRVILKLHPLSVPWRNGKATTLAVLSPYRAQVRELSSAIDRADPTLRKHLKAFAKVGDSYVHTVDSFQGQEADVVIVSLVRNNGRLSLRGALGFLADERRMNVLFSRAQWRLIVVGSKSFLEAVATRRRDPEEYAKAGFLRLLLEGIEQARREHAAHVVLGPSDAELSRRPRRRGRRRR